MLNSMSKLFNCKKRMSSYKHNYEKKKKMSNYMQTR